VALRLPRLGPVTSLRARLMLGLLALAAVGLVILDVVSYTALRSYLMDRVDQQVRSTPPELVVRSIAANKFFKAARKHGEQVPSGGPGGGLPIQPGPSAGETAGPQPPPGIIGEVLNANGKVIGRTPSFGESAGPRPQLPAQVPLSASQDNPNIFTVPGSGGSSSGFRALALAAPDGSSIVVALSLSDVDHTLARLQTIELIVSAAILAALAALAWWVIRLGLRPLERMEQTANAIAGGDLSARVESTDERTEVGRLGAALNAMLGQIERAFDQRQASEDRLRRFLADASHELRTPLSSIRGYAELFRLGPAQEPEQLEKAMSRIEDESARMGVLVDDLLTLARLDEVREPVREPVDLAAVTADACDDARAAAPDRAIDLAREGSAEVLGDGDELRRVAANLLRNALSHTPAGTPVEVSVSSEAGRVLLKVRDHGPGLPPDAGDQVFERFWRQGGSPARNGAGLGLAIVAAIVAAHGGQAHAANADGGGAVFTIVLPARDIASERAAT
jgi:two-component system, OmpR family, sensor kinase